MSSEIKGLYTVTLDDDPMIHKIVAAVTGWPSIPFNSVAGILTRAERYRPHAAFLDIHLGDGGHGLDVLGKLRRFWPECSLIVITSDESPCCLKDALALGADDFMRKPLVKDELLARMQRRHHDRLLVNQKLQHRWAGLCLDLADETLSFDNKRTPIATSDARVLRFFIDNPQIEVSKKELMQRFWPQQKVCLNAIDQKLRSLRQLLRHVGAPVKLKAQYGGIVSLVTNEAPKENLPRQS